MCTPHPPAYGPESCNVVLRDSGVTSLTLCWISWCPQRHSCQCQARSRTARSTESLPSSTKTRAKDVRRTPHESLPGSCHCYVVATGVSCFVLRGPGEHPQRCTSRSRALRLQPHDDCKIGPRHRRGSGLCPVGRSSSRSIHPVLKTAC